MTETADQPYDGVPDSEPHPCDILLHLIVALLAPMFLTASGGDIHFARAAAIETVSDYRAQSRMDLIGIAQIIAFGLAALGSLSLSMEDGLSATMTLRLRANANACNRSAEQNRRALAASRPPAPQPLPRQPEPREAASTAKTTTARQPAAETQRRPAPAATPTLAAAAVAERQHQAMWGAAAAHVAAEYTADLPNLPPAQRRAASIRAAMLNSCAQNLLNGPPIPRVQPNDLTAFLQSAEAMRSDRD